MQVRAGIQVYPGRLLLVIDGADESVDLSTLMPSDERGVLHLVVTTSTPEMKVAGSVEVRVSCGFYVLRVEGFGCELGRVDDRRGLLHSKVTLKGLMPSAKLSGSVVMRSQRRS